MVPLRVVVLTAVLAVSAATNVEQCPGQSTEHLSEMVELTPCKRTPCKLKKGSDQHISIKFQPSEDLNDLKNRVTAEVFGVPLPFIGVDGISICDKLQTESGEKASCPLKANTVYVYKDSFPVLSIYPTIAVKVHWALKHGQKDIVCFEVPARIT